MRAIFSEIISFNLDIKVCRSLGAETCRDKEPRLDLGLYRTVVRLALNGSHPKRIEKIVTRLRQSVSRVTIVYILIFTSYANTVELDEKALPCFTSLSLLIGVHCTLENEARA